VVEVVIRHPVAVVAAGGEIALLAPEHVEVAVEALALVQHPDRTGRPAYHVGAGERLVVERRALEPADHQHPEVRPVVEHRRARHRRVRPARS
jgi:hypothetical protein